MVFGARFAEHRGDSCRWQGRYQGMLEVSCVLCKPSCPRVGHPQVGGPRLDSCAPGSGIGACAAGSMCPAVLPAAWPCARPARPFSLECLPGSVLHPSHFWSRLCSQVQVVAQGPGFLWQALTSVSLPACTTQALQPENQLGTSRHILSASHSWVGHLPPHPTVTCVHAGALLSLACGYSVHSMGPVTHIIFTHWPAGPASLTPPLTLCPPEMSCLLGACLYMCKGWGCPVLGRWVDRWMHGGRTAERACSPPQLLGATCQSRHAAGPGAGRFRVCVWPASPPAFPRTLGRRCAFCLPPSMPQSWYAPWVRPSLECFPCALLGCGCPLM